MSIQWFVIVLVGLASPWTAATSEPEKPLKERISEIAREEAARYAELQDVLKDPGADGVGVAVANNVYNPGSNRRRKALEGLVKENRDDPVVFDALLVLVVQMGNSLDNALTAIASQHLSDPRAGELCFRLRSRNGEPWAEVLLMQAAQTHPIRDVRGQAVFALGDYYRYSAFPFRKKLHENEVARLLERASRWYSEAARDFASAPTPDGKSTIGEKSELELTRLRNLPNLKIGKPAPEISGEGLDGRTFKLSDYRGKVAVVIFWGTGCRPCLEMVPDERKLWDRLEDGPFILLGVNCGDSREIARATKAKYRMDWPSWWDGGEFGGPISTAYNSHGLPTTYVIDPQGVIRFVDVRGKELEEAVDSLLAVPAANPNPPAP